MRFIVFGDSKGKNNGINKKILNALGRHGVAFRNDSGISTTIKWNTSAKASTEYARGAFGRTPEDFVKNINYLLSKAATAGNSCPSKNSNEAPPPVEIWLNLSP